MVKNNFLDYIFILSGENLKLAKEEVLSLISAKNYELIGKLLIVNSKSPLNINELSNRLAFTKSIHQLLFKCNKKDLIKKIANYDWNSIYKDNFCVRIHHQKNLPDLSTNLFVDSQANLSASLLVDSQANLSTNVDSLANEDFFAKYIWNKIRNPKVDLEHPKTLINLFFINNKIFCTKVQKILKKNFEKRRPHLRPSPSPTSLNPKIARAVINLTGVEGKEETIADLFCGSGGIPIEAGLMGFPVVANDISKKMLWKAIVNLRHYKIKNYQILQKDALKINKKFDYVVSDLPYGLNSRIYFNRKKFSRFVHEQARGLACKGKLFSYSELEEFYLKVLKRLKKIVKKRIVLIFPNFVNYKNLVKKSGLKLKNEFEIYVHKNLTRKIVVMEK